MGEKDYSSALAQFAGKRIMVIGDLMLDEHVWGTVERISPEAPVMVVQVDSDSDCLPGGAANVANNIRALGGEASLVGVVGEDEGADILRQVLTGKGINIDGVFTDDKRPTTRKTRIWASHRNQIVRIDRESKRKVSRGIIERMIDHIKRESSQYDAIVISDYAKGVVSKETVSTVVSAAGDGKITVSNAKPRNMAYYGGIKVITVNQSEASAASGIDIDNIGDIEHAGKKIINTARCGGLVITRGSHGLSVFENGGAITHIPPIETEVYDVAGAGDTVVSALTMALASGLGLAASAKIANCAGGAVVRKVGVATTTPDEIIALLSQRQIDN